MSNLLEESFRKEAQPKKVILVSSLVVFISTFLPWLSISFGGFGSVSTNGWHRFGILTVLGSIAMVLLWLLPKFGIDLSLSGKQVLVEKIVALVMLAGPMAWLIDNSFEFAFMRAGFYLGLIASSVTVYFVFVSAGAKK